MKWRTWSAAMLLVAADPVSAQQSGHAFGATTLRAGPSHGYPQVATVSRGDGLQVQGCVASWIWCDVRWQEQRGWVPAAMIEFDARADGSTVASLVPAVAFSLDDYWNAHYRGRSWSRERARWRQLPAPQEAMLPAPLTHQLAPPERQAPPPAASPPSSVPQPAAWIPPNERMEHQLPPPDALNPNRNRDQTWRRDTSPRANWWPLHPEEIKRIEEEKAKRKEKESEGQKH